MISRWLLYTASNPKAGIRVSTQIGLREASMIRFAITSSVLQQLVIKQGEKRNENLVYTGHRRYDGRRAGRLCR